MRIRTILLVVNLIVILVPLSGIYFFKLYENELVRQTETELIAQGAFISALFRHEAKALEADNVGRVLASVPPPLDEIYKPMPAQLDMSSTPLLPERDDALPTANVASKAHLSIAQRLVPILEEARLTTLAAYALMDDKGTVLLGPEAGLSLAHLPEVQQALQGRYSASLRLRGSDSQIAALSSLSRNTVFRAFVAYPVLEENRLYGVVLLSRSPRNVLKALYEERRSVLLAAGMVAVAVCLISLLTSLAISQPIKSLLTQVRRIAEGEDATAAIALPVTREIAELSAQMQQMAEKLQARTEYIRQFALHVSHEFKTPLTSIQGALELLCEHDTEMTLAERERFIANTLEDTARLKLLVARMLELARAEASDARKETCDVATLIAKLQSRYRDRGVSVQAEISDAVSALPLPADIAETVLVNLCDNSAQQDAKEVRLALFLEDQSIVLRVADDAGGISPANTAQLFTPFFTTHRETGGTGLGLSIIKALLKSYSAEIALIAASPHAVFQIRFRKNEYGAIKA